jgi:putative ABC transport system ATP-binding protein
MAKSLPHTVDVSAAPVLQGSDLSLRFGEALVFSEVTVCLARGDMLLLTGPSGSGKTSLLRVLARLQNPTSGTVALNGTVTGNADIPSYRRRVAYLQQQPVMVRGSVRDNLLLSQRYGGEVRPSDDELREGISQLGIASIPLEKEASQLSVGQQQRIALLRLLLMRPSVLLLDEPTAALDPVSAASLVALVATLHEKHALSTVLVSHHSPVLPEGLQLRQAVLENGHLEPLS